MSLLERATSANIRGFLDPRELDKLAELASGRDVLEIGSFKGLSAWGMAQTAKHVYCIDTFEAAEDGQEQTGVLTTFDEFKRAVAGFSNVLWLVASSKNAAAMIDRDFDMIFLDAMHTYEDVKADIRRWFPRLRTPGVFALHDYGHTSFEGVKRAADEILGPAPEGTVIGTLRWLHWIGNPI